MILLHRFRLSRLATLAAVVVLGCAEAPEATAGPPSDHARDEVGAARVAWIESEVGRLRDVVVALGEDAASSGATLDGVVAELTAGRDLAALAALLPLRVHLDALREARQAAETPESAAVQARLDAEREAIAALRLRLAALDGPAAPAVHRALAAAADNRADGLLAGGRGFAATGQSLGAHYYAAQARLETATAVALLELPGGAPRQSPSPRGLAELLDELEREATLAYRRPGAETEQHAAFIALNAGLKEARELLAADRDLGALLALLGARRRLATIAAAAGEAATLDPAALRRRMDAATEGLDVGRDDSIARLFLQEAQAALAPPPDREPRPASAAAVLDHVLPLYHRLVETAP